MLRHYVEYIKDFGTMLSRVGIGADERFYASISVSPTDPQQAAAEIHRLGDHARVLQVIMPAGARMPYGNRFYHPIYEAAQEHGLPICVHFGAEGAARCSATLSPAARSCRPEHAGSCRPAGVAE